MKVDRKIKAFTLVELIVVIAISTVLAGLAFSVIRLVQNNTNTIAKNYSSKSRIQSFEVGLKANFNNFTNVYWNGSTEALKFTSPIDERVCSFYDDSIRLGRQIFKIKLLEKQLYFRGEKVKEKEIDAIRLVFDVSGQELPIFVYKHNDLTTQFEYGN